MNESDRKLPAQQPQDKSGEAKTSPGMQYEEIRRELQDINTKLDKNTLEGNRITLAVVGISIAMAGIVLWIQTEFWSPYGNLLVFCGFLVMGLAALQNKAGFKKWMRIAFWVVLGLLIILVLVVIRIVLSH